MKDESEGKINDEFVGLKSKMYSIKNIDGKESNTAKQVNIATEFSEFKNTLFNKKIMRHKMKRIQAKKHKVGTYEIDRISLSCFDDKRFVLNDGIHMLAYFHKDLKKQIFTDYHKEKEILTDKKRFKKIFIKEEILTDKKVSKRVLMKKKRFSQIKKYFHKKNRFSQMITSKNK